MFILWNQLTDSQKVFPIGNNVINVDTFRVSPKRQHSIYYREHWIWRTWCGTFAMLQASCVALSQSHLIYRKGRIIPYVPLQCCESTWENVEDTQKCLTLMYFYILKTCCVLKLITGRTLRIIYDLVLRPEIYLMRGKKSLWSSVLFFLGLLYFIPMCSENSNSLDAAHSSPSPVHHLQCTYTNTVTYVFQILRQQS